MPSLSTTFLFLATKLRLDSCELHQTGQILLDSATRAGFMEVGLDKLAYTGPSEWEFLLPVNRTARDLVGASLG